jgi:hypothetical protein
VPRGAHVRIGDGFLNDPLQMIGGQAVDQAIIEFAIADRSVSTIR